MLLSSISLEAEPQDLPHQSRSEMLSAGSNSRATECWVPAVLVSRTQLTDIRRPPLSENPETNGLDVGDIGCGGAFRTPNVASPTLAVLNEKERYYGRLGRCAPPACRSTAIADPTRAAITGNARR